MRLRSILPVLLLLGCATAALAQSEFVSLADWRVHAGDDAAWARPDFDDSAWTRTSFPKTEFHELNAQEWHWYRTTFPVPAELRGQQLSLGLGAFDDVYEVYVEGVSIGSFGAFEPAPHAPYPKHASFPIPPSLLQGPIGHIAIRRWKGASSTHMQAYYAGGTYRYDHQPRLGPAVAIEAQEKLDMANGLIQMMPADLTAILFLFAGAISFVLYSVQRRRAEYLYLGLTCLANGMPPLLGILTSTSQTMDSRSWESILVMCSAVLYPGMSFVFLAAICPRFRRTLLAGAVLSGVIAVAAAYCMAVDSGLQVPVVQAFTYVLPLFPLIAVVGLLQDRDKGSLTMGVVLLLNGALIVWTNTSALLHKPTTLFVGRFFIDVRNVGGVVFIFVVLVVLYLRYRDEQARQAAAEQSLAAARRMQEHLLGTSGASPAGFEVTAVYRPAQEVGGDFYRTELLEDGSLLVVLGDVSGKGLDAALLVAAVLGGLAIEKEKRPATLLDDLNNAVTGRTGGGFITACCARFYPDGRVVIANAGHIAPYIDGREVQLENSLPLGITAQTSYGETAIQAAGTVTFLSDGVVEARDAKGELLGFERMAALTVRPAAEIADAAQRWGQEDDITVLTVRSVAVCA
jgi:sigma-B regulation protein RsbU (phosphoserine phosphatase)